MLNHHATWGTTQEGMSLTSPAKAAYVGDGNIMLISPHAVASNTMPPGFERFLTEVECADNGIAAH